jgi:hypothetical protein
MNVKLMGIVAFVAALTVPVAALAESASSYTGASVDSTALVNQLQRHEQMDEFKAKFWSQEPVTQQDYYVQEKEDRQLIAKISAGEPVSPSELTQALTRVDTEY